jgi:capsular exopolysaccharide synthesis family protein
VEWTTKNYYQYDHIEDDDTLNFKEVFLRYLKLWRWFLLSFIVSFIIAFVVNKLTPPVYKVESKFLIKEDGNTMDLIDFSTTVNRDVLPHGQKIANETIVLKSRVIAEEVLDLLHFDVEYYAVHNYSEGKFIDSEIYKNAPIAAEIDWNHNQLTNGRIKISWMNHMSYRLEFLDKEYSVFIPGEDQNGVMEKPILLKNDFAFGEWVDLPYTKFRLSVTGAKSIGTCIIKFRDRRSLITQYTGDNLQISPVDRLSSILLLSLETEQPQKGRDYLNTLMGVFLDNELDKKNSMDINTINFIDNQLSGISDSLNYTENKLERFQSSRRTYNITTEGSTIFEQLSDLERLLSEEKYKKEYYQHLQSYLIDEDYSGIVVPSGLGIEDPVLNRLIEDLIVLQSDKSRFLATQTENSPTVLEVNRKISDLNASIKEVLKNVAYNTDLLISDLEKRISKIEAQFGALPETEQDLLNLKRSYTLNENLYTFLLQKRAESSISLASNKPSNKIIEHAVADFIPLQLRPLLNYFLALLLGLIIPMSIIFLIDFFAVKIKDIKEVEQKLKVPILGNIGHNKESSQLIALNQPRVSIAESFRAIRTDINFISSKEKQKTIMITSNISGEGKTFCAINLASTYSMSGKKTVLVGCDLHKSFKFEDFNISNANGLSTYLAGQVKKLLSVVQKTEYSNLDVLVPGPVPPNPAELLISDRFGIMLEELKESYEVIILDSSPLGLTNETLYLTRYADFCIFVLRHNYSKKSFVDDINKLKVKKGIKNLYVILNDIKKKYLSHGGYGYGYYAEDELQQPILKKIFSGSKRPA